MRFFLADVICIVMIFTFCGTATTKDKEEVKNTKEEEYIKQNFKTEVIYDTNIPENADRIKNFIVGIWENGEGGYEFFNNGIVEIDYTINFSPHMTVKEMKANERIEKGKWKLEGRKLSFKVNNNEYIYTIEKYQFVYDPKGFRKYRLRLFFNPSLYQAGNRLWRSFN